ncbi:hypothetical protein [Diaphorobacter caeni]|uniref:hypothetical protein n=1 Tax=Diaphorobacter caeni TaxID=2784387 RepID=UPI00188FC410|nr:hypothetical protein [Diaphorobacter caeni]MBF5007941.1 hypothetical protein [Diaphorobacter caeni]
MLTLTTHAKGALFTQEGATGNKPCMSGVIELADAVSLNIAGFLKSSKESGSKYLNLKVSERDPQSQYAVYGRLFRNERMKGPKSPDYTGFLEIAKGEFLRIAAWKEISSKNQKAFLSLDIQRQDHEPESEDGLPI